MSEGIGRISLDHYPLFSADGDDLQAGQGRHVRGRPGSVNINQSLKLKSERQAQRHCEKDFHTHTHKHTQELHHCDTDRRGLGQKGDEDRGRKRQRKRGMGRAEMPPDTLPDAFWHVHLKSQDDDEDEDELRSCHSALPALRKIRQSITKSITIARIKGKGNGERGTGKEERLASLPVISCGDKRTLCKTHNFFPFILSFLLLTIVSSRPVSSHTPHTGKNYGTV